MRVEQLLFILNAIGVEPSEFFLELYPSLGLGTQPPAPPPRDAGRELEALRRDVEAVIGLLLHPGVIGLDELAEAVRTVKMTGNNRREGGGQGASGA